MPVSVGNGSLSSNGETFGGLFSTKVAFSSFKNLCVLDIEETTWSTCFFVSGLTNMPAMPVIRQRMMKRLRSRRLRCYPTYYDTPVADFSRNNDVLSRSLWNLMSILSTWTISVRGSRQNRCQQGLTLELGVFSPSDSKHAFRDFRLEQDYPYQEEKDLEPKWEAYHERADELRLDNLYEPSRTWNDNFHSYVSFAVAQRVMSTVKIDLDTPNLSAIPKTFPRVEIITGLLIRRQFYRKIAASSLSKLICESLPCIGWFRHEGWHNVDPVEQKRFERGKLKINFLAI